MRIYTNLRQTVDIKCLTCIKLLSIYLRTMYASSFPVPAFNPSVIFIDFLFNTYIVTGSQVKVNNIYI